MNEMQRKVLIVVAILVVAMLLYPPYSMQNEWGSKVQIGYTWLFEGYAYSSVDVAMLFTQWIGVLIVGGIAFLLARTK